MKRLSFLLLISFLTFQGYTQFKASMQNVKSGKEEIYTVYSDKTQYRYDFTQNDQKTIIIVKPQLNKTLILLPDRKFYMQQACDGMMSRQNDPFQAYAMMKANYTEKDAGKENVEGIACNKKEIYADNDKEANYKMIAENKTEKPAKIIRSSFRDGKELPEKIQGPEKYRTLRLYPEEKVPGTFIWKAGNEVHIKIFEGTMYLDIHIE